VSDEKSIRAFLAVDPPEEVLNEVGRIQDRFKKTIQGDIRWVRPEGIHLTLKFFGYVSEADIANISQVVRNSIVNVKPFTLNVRRVGVFPSVNRARVLWLGMDGDVDTLIDLQKKIDKGLQEYGFEMENRPLSPHVTLARIKEPKGLIGLAKIIEKSEEYAAGSFSVGDLNLFKSTLTPKGAIYTKLAYFPFAE
jgi:2'-5' RNA ligase